MGGRASRDSACGLWTSVSGRDGAPRGVQGVGRKGLGPRKGLGLPERLQNPWTWWWVQRQALSEPLAPPETPMTNGRVCWGDRDGCAGAIDHPALGATQLCRLVPPPTSPPSPAPGWRGGLLPGLAAQEVEGVGQHVQEPPQQLLTPGDPEDAWRPPPCVLVHKQKTAPDTSTHPYTPQSTFICTHVPTRDCVHASRGACTHILPARHPIPLIPGSRGALVVGQEQSPHAQRLQQLLATRGLQLTHAIGPCGTWGAPHRVWCRGGDQAPPRLRTRPPTPACLALPSLFLQRRGCFVQTIRM